MSQVMRWDAAVGLLMLALLALVTDLAVARPLLQPAERPLQQPDSPFDKMASLVTPYGYTLEEHFVTTVDSFILRLFRVGHPDAPMPPGLVRRPVVHLQHGLLGSSSDFCLPGPGKALPFLLVDAGYDVWLGNVRGNTYSRNHTHLQVLDPRFWAFSWDDMALKDLPTMLVAELSLTGVTSLGYVGHSQGTTVALALLSSGHDVVQHINVAVLLAPVAFATHIDSIPLVTLAQLNTDEMFALLGIHEFMPSIEILSRLEGSLCTLRPELCVSMLSALCGYNPANLDSALLPAIVAYTPSGTSVQNMAHWSQMMRSSLSHAMRAYDFGTRCRTVLDLPRPCNQRVYGQDTPPTYNLSAITTPLGLFTGGADKLSDPLDVELMLAALPRHLVWLWHDEPDYEHLDFIWGINAKDLLYNKVMQLLQHGALAHALVGRAGRNGPSSAAVYDTGAVKESSVARRGLTPAT